MYCLGLLFSCTKFIQILFVLKTILSTNHDVLRNFFDCECNLEWWHGDAMRSRVVSCTMCFVYVCIISWVFDMNNTSIFCRASLCRPIRHCSLLPMVTGSVSLKHVAYTIFNNCTRTTSILIIWCVSRSGTTDFFLLWCIFVWRFIIDGQSVCSANVSS